MSERKELQLQPSTDKRREEIARIIDPEEWALQDKGRQPDGSFLPGCEVFLSPSLAKADAIMALPPLEDGWQDIASAPKKGVPFWAYQPGREQFVCWEQDTRDGVIWMDEIDSEPEPTHWRPLPAPPSNPETKGEA